MKRCVVSVRAVPGGWSVSSDSLAGPLMFLSGGRAEREAHRLSEALARSGAAVETSVYDRAGGLLAQITRRADTTLDLVRPFLPSRTAAVPPAANAWRPAPAGAVAASAHA